MRYGVGPIPLRTGLWDKRGLKLRVPCQFKEKGKGKQNPWLVVFEGIFLRQRWRTTSAVPPHANLSSAVKHLICPRAWTQPGSKAGPRMIQACTKGHCTSYFTYPATHPISSLSLSPQTSDEVLLYLWAKARHMPVFHLRTSQRTVVSGTNRFWLGSTQRVNRGGDIQRNHKTFLQSSSPPVQ